MSAVIGRRASAGVAADAPPSGHERIVGDTLGFLAARCRSAGLRADEVFVHAGGQYAPWEKHVSHRTAIGRGAVPGWSLYNTDPRQAGDLGDSLRQASRRDWCAAEWLSFAPPDAAWNSRRGHIRLKIMRHAPAVVAVERGAEWSVFLPSRKMPHSRQTTPITNRVNAMVSPGPRANSRRLMHLDAKLRCLR